MLAPWKKVKVKSLGCVQLFMTPWTIVHQAPPSMGFSRQEYWCGFLFPSPGDLPNPGIEPRSPALQADSLTSEPPGLRKVMTNLDSLLKSRDITLPTKVHLVKAMVFPLLIMYSYESWTMKKAEHWRNWCFWTMVLEKTLESPLDCQEIQPVHSEGDQSWVFIGGTDVEAETPILWPCDAKILRARIKVLDSFERTLKLGKI